MKKQIKQVNGGILQVTTLDERWYVKEVEDKITGLPTHLFVPSSTWIADHYPKGIGFYKWLADKGWDEAESLKSAAGDRGSKVHFAIKDLLDNKVVNLSDKYLNPGTCQEEELTLDEWECLMSFRRWFSAVKPQTIATEISFVAQDVDGVDYGGTIDWIGIINDELHIVDWKTSQSIWPAYGLQISSYAHAVPQLGRTTWPQGVSPVGLPKMMILQIGYKRNKNGYKENTIDDKFDLFKAAYQIWQDQNPEAAPKQASYPLTLKLDGEPTLTTDGPTTGEQGTDGHNSLPDIKKPVGPKSSIIIKSKASKGHNKSVNVG